MFSHVNLFLQPEIVQFRCKFTPSASDFASHWNRWRQPDRRTEHRHTKLLAQHTGWFSSHATKMSLLRCWLYHWGLACSQHVKPSRCLFPSLLQLGCINHLHMKTRKPYKGYSADLCCVFFYGGNFHPVCAIMPVQLYKTKAAKAPQFLF